MTHTARWIDALRGADVLDVADRLGLQVIEGRGTSPGSFACDRTCPQSNFPQLSPAGTLTAQGNAADQLSMPTRS